MAHDAVNESGSNAIVLDANLCLDDAGSLHARFNAIDAQQDVTLDGSRIATIDTSGLQLLAALLVRLRKNGSRLVWVAPSDALLNAARLTGLSGLLGLDAA